MQVSHLQVSATLLPTGSRISRFAAGLRPLGAAKRVVYVDGTFDCFHVVHTCCCSLAFLLFATVMA